MYYNNIDNIHYDVPRRSINYDISFNECNQLSINLTNIFEVFKHNFYNLIVYLSDINAYHIEQNPPKNVQLIVIFVRKLKKC